MNSKILNEILCYRLNVLHSFISHESPANLIRRILLLAVLLCVCKLRSLFSFCVLNAHTLFHLCILLLSLLGDYLEIKIVVLTAYSATGENSLAFLIAVIFGLSVPTELNTYTKTRHLADNHEQFAFNCI